MLWLLSLARSSRDVASLQPGTAPPDCAVLVDRPVDPSPIRSPQAVHSVIAERVVGKDLAEIGTRNGDGMACFSQFARSAVAIEMQPDYCTKLRRRSQAAGSGNFSVLCDMYQKSIPDADVYTWWQEPPHLENSEVLRYLRRLQLDGKIRRDAEALVLFDHSWPPDMDSWRKLGHLASWEHTLDFDEYALCLQMLPEGHADRHWCPRAREGKFTVGAIRIRDVDAQPDGQVVEPAARAVKSRAR